jgi:hypothetical protein
MFVDDDEKLLLPGDFFAFYASSAPPGRGCSLHRSICSKRMISSEACIF